MATLPAVANDEQAAAILMLMPLDAIHQSDFRDSYDHRRIWKGPAYPKGEFSMRFWAIFCGLSAACSFSGALAGEIGAGLRLAGTYLCSVDSGGGVAANASTQRWSGVLVQGQQQFVFKLALTGTIDTTKAFDTFKSSVGEYEAHLKYAGTDLSDTCQVNGSNKIPIGDEGILQCNTLYADYLVNLPNLRIASISSKYAYVNGEDDTGEMAVQIGTCTKID